MAIITKTADIFLRSVKGSPNIATDRKRLNAKEVEFQRIMIHPHCWSLKVQNANKEVTKYPAAPAINLPEFSELADLKRVSA